MGRVAGANFEQAACIRLQVWRRSIHVDVLLIQRGTFYGVTLELAMGFDRVNIVKAVIGGLSRRGKRGIGRASAAQITS